MKILLHANTLAVYFIIYSRRALKSLKTLILNSFKKCLISSPQPEELSPQNNNLLTEVDKHERGISILKKQIEDLQCENIFLKEEVTTKNKLYRQNYSYENISQDQKHFLSQRQD